MTRSQALTLGVLIGFVALAFIAAIMILTLPENALFPPTATPVPPTPTTTPTPTFPKFLPTPSPKTATPKPTPTNTRVPTPTPAPTRTPTPTVVFTLPAIRPAATATPTPALPPAAAPGPTATPIPLPTPTPVPRQLRVIFEADESTITRGECTDLIWQVDGAASVRLEGKSVPPSGTEEVCPRHDTSYRLTIELPESAQVEYREVAVTVTEK